LAATQFDEARRLDPNDRRPGFYDAILKDSQSRPAALWTTLKRQQN
jgi:hypothetical protein